MCKTILLFTAAGNGVLPLAQFALLLGADPNAADDDLGWCPLTYGRDYPEMVKLLVRNGANIDGRNGEITPLMQAVRLEDVVGVRVLLENGARPEILDYRGHSAIWYLTHDHDQWPQSYYSVDKERLIANILRQK